MYTAIPPCPHRPSPYGRNKLPSAHHGGQSRKRTASKFALSHAHHINSDRRSGPRPYESCSKPLYTRGLSYRQGHKERTTRPRESHYTLVSVRTQKRARTSFNLSTGSYTMASLANATDTPRRTSVPYATAPTPAHILHVGVMRTKNSR